MSFHHVQSVVELQGLLVDEELGRRREEGRRWRGGTDEAWTTALVADILDPVGLVGSEERLLPVEGGEAGVGGLVLGGGEGGGVLGGDAELLVVGWVPLLAGLGPGDAGGGGEEVGWLGSSEGRCSLAPTTAIQIEAGGVAAGSHRVLVAVTVLRLRLDDLVKVLIEDLVESHWVLILATHCED